MLTLVPDTNVLLQGFLSHQNNERLLLNLAIAGRVRLYGSQFTMDEFAEKIHIPRLEKYLESKMYSPEKVISDYKSLVGMVTIDPPFVGKTYCADPDDDEFFRICESSDSKIIISSDKHLLNVDGIQGIKVVRVDKFLQSFRKLNGGKFF